MVEVIDISSKVKMMAIIMAGIEYNDDKYIIYCVDRGSGDANIFVSKLVMTSEGYIFNNEFDNGEKEVLDGIVKKIINKEDIEKDGFHIINNIDLGDVNYFDIDKCYVATTSKKVIKEIMIYYKLVNDKILERPVVEVVEDKRLFNEGFVGNIFLIVFGIVVVIFSIVVILGVF